MKTKKLHQRSGNCGPSRRGIVVKGKWKSVKLDASLFSGEDLGGLVCFEELTDYTLVKSDKTTELGERSEENEKGKKGKKRKASAVDLEEDLEAVDETEEVTQETDSEKDVQVVCEPVKKKKKKKKPKKDKTLQDDVSGKVEVKDAGDEKTEKESSEGDFLKSAKDGEDDTLEDIINQDAETSQDAATNAELEKGIVTDKKKTKKKRKKKKKKATTQVANPESEDTDAIVPAAPVSQARPSPKTKAKNWTSAALSGSEDQNADVSAWEGLFVPDLVLKALSKLGFTAPTPIQALALPSAIRDHLDILGAAETGSGKTLSFGIPAIHTILEWKKASDAQMEESDVGQATNSVPEVESIYLPTVSDAPNPSVEASEVITTSTEKSEKDLDPEAALTDIHSENDVPQGKEDEHDVSEECEEDVDSTHNDCDDDSDGDSDADEDEDCSGKAGDGEDDDAADDADDADDADEMGCTIKTLDFEKEEDKQDRKHPLLCLVLTPTRELAVQVKHHIDAVAQFTGIKTAVVVGGMAPQKQERILNRKPEIVVATPGRLWEMITGRHPHLLNLRNVRCLVIDEADRMVEKGHFAELENLLEMLNTSQFNPKRQTFVFSATLTLIHSMPARLQKKKKGKRQEQHTKLELLMEKVGVKDKPKIIDLTRKETTVETLTETRIHCEKDDKDFYLYYFLLQYPGRTMVFANSIDCIKRLNSLLVILDCTPLPLHANMHQKQRLKNLERFAERGSCVLLTTDVAARGLDIPNVEHVIHYQVPRTSETYVHRSGRTARAAKEGLSLLLIGPDDMMNYKKIYRTLGKDEDLPMFPIETKCMAAIKERVNLARQIEKIEFHNCREKQHNSWFRQAAEAMEVDLDDDLLLGGRKNEEDDRQQQKLVKGMKKHLKHLLAQPVFRNIMKTKYPTQMGKLNLPQLPRACAETAITSVANQKQRRRQKQKPKQQK